MVAKKSVKYVLWYIDKYPIYILTKYIFYVDLLSLKMLCGPLLVQSIVVRMYNENKWIKTRLQVLS